jgi:hypothetical protein
MINFKMKAQMSNLDEIVRLITILFVDEHLQSARLWV